MNSGAIACRNAVHLAKEKVERYRRNSIASDVCQPPPFNPHYKQSGDRHQRSSTCPDFLYPQLEGAWGWNASQSMMNSTSVTDQTMNDLSLSKSNYH